VLIGMEHRDRILTHYDDVGLRGLLRDPEVRVTEVPWRESLEDLDSPEDYRRAVGTAGA
jgi:CTP:molybdopterin cytidylyltransferase MocA